MIHRSSAVLTLAFTTCLGFSLGCDPSPRATTGDSGATVDTSNDEAPGPQTEPALNADSTGDVGPPIDGSSKTTLSVPVIDRAGLDAVLAQYKGQVVLIDFWATWCVPCRKKFPHTVELAKSHHADGLVVIGVAIDDEDAQADVEKFLTENHATFDNFRSQDGVSDESFEAFEIPGGAIPCLRLYDRDGQIVKTFAIDPTADKQFTDADVAAAVKTALSQK